MGKSPTVYLEDRLQRTVLVVDDEESIRALYELELGDEGYRVLTAHDGDTAHEILSAKQVDLVVLDIKLKGESGLKVLKDINSSDRKIPVILSTAFGAYKDDISSWMADAYVVKSGNMDELKQQIDRVIERRYGAG